MKWSYEKLFIFLNLLIGLTVICEGQIRFPNSGGRRPFPRPQRPQGPQRPISPRPAPPKEEGPTSGCNCLLKSECQKGFGQLSTGCVAESGREGICCIPQENQLLTRVGFSDADVAPASISTRTVSDAFQASQNVFNDFSQAEATRLRRGEFLKRGDPARGHSFFFQRSPSAKKTHNLAYLIAQSSREVANKESLSPRQSFFSLPQTRTGSSLPFQCPLNNVPRCDPNSKYRTIDGSCNNLQKPLLGRSETGFSRISPPLYEDGIMAPKITGVDGEPLPNVREAANTILLDVDRPSPEFTLGVMQWAQFMDHDLTHAPFDDMGGEGIRCCENGRLVSPMPDQCFPITIFPNDAFYGPRNQRCINFVRSMLALNEGCALGAVEQLNALTHWVDGSMIYGSTEEEEDRVVDRSTGFMRISTNNLPPLNSSIDCDARTSNTVCFAGGDSRINEQPALTVMHTLWVREHNRIAELLKRLNPSWDAKKLFEETRRIVIAQVQHITYREWLPIIIGQSLMDRLRINTLSSGYRSSYNPNADPRMSNEFATAAFRFGHSLVQGLFRLISNSGRSSSARLRDTFNDPGILQRNPSLVDSFVNSLTVQNIQGLDNFVTDDLSNHLFQTPRIDFGMDLMSLNLQRGREHAISTYNQMREKFGIGKARNFLDLRSTTDENIIKRIQSVYRNVDDIDLFIGGMTEESIRDALLGPTFANIVGRQFQDVMNGDRFFYDLGGQPGSFTPEQLREIRKSSMARVYCDNSNVGTMQPFAFRTISRQNPRVPCSSDVIPSIDLSVFK